MQFDTSNLVNILIAVGSFAGLCTVLAKVWLKKHGLNNGTMVEMKKSVQRTESKLDTLNKSVGELKVSMAKTEGQIMKVANKIVGDHEQRYHPRGIR